MDLRLIEKKLPGRDPRPVCAAGGVGRLRVQATPSPVQAPQNLGRDPGGPFEKPTPRPARTDSTVGKPALPSVPSSRVRRADPALVQARPDRFCAPSCPLRPPHPHLFGPGLGQAERAL